MVVGREPADGEMQNLLLDLRSRSRRRRLAAAKNAGEQRANEAIGDLITCLHDESYLVQAESAYSLGLIGDPCAVPALFEVHRGNTFSYTSGSGTPMEFGSLVDAGAFALGRIGGEGVDALIGSLNSTERTLEYVLEAALLGLRQSRDRRVLDECKAKLKDGDPRVRANAVLCCATLDPTSVTIAAEALAEKEFHVRYAAIVALAEIEDSAVDPLLAEAFARPEIVAGAQSFYHTVLQPRGQVRVAAARSLARRQGGVALLEMYFENGDPDDRLDAAVGLASIGHEEAFEELRAVCKPVSTMRVQTAILGLESATSDRAVPPLTRLIKNNDVSGVHTNLAEDAIWNRAMRQAGWLVPYHLM